MALSLTMTQISDGSIFLGGSLYRARNDSWRQVLYRSRDNGKTWSEPIVVLDDPKYCPNEGCIVEMPGGTLVMYDTPRRTSAAGRSR